MRHSISRVIRVSTLPALFAVGQFLVVQSAASQSSAARAVAERPAPSRVGRRGLLPRDEEIALARSAAPSSVSARATVLVFTDTGFVVAERGTNGVTCIVNRSWPASLEPHCFDEEASTTILPMELQRTMLYHRGRPEAGVEREITAGLASGKFRLPRRPAMSYMMSGGQQLVGDDGVAAGHWRPHVMVYFPFLTNRDMGFASAPDMSVGMVAEESTPSSSLMIIMPKFVPVTARAP